MIITNVQLVLENEVINGSIEIKDGLIRAMSDSSSQRPEAINANQSFLMPGLIELHTDNLEKYFTPRPKVNWPALSAMAAHDAQLIGSGITTVLDAIAVGDVRDGGHRQENLDKMIDTIIESGKLGLNRAEHFVHIRCELPHSATVELAEKYLDLEQIHMVSLMDHSPGQRQFVNINKYNEYYQGKYNLSDQQMAEFEQYQRAQSLQWSGTNRKAIAKLCREKHIPLASHDDATSLHVEESHSLGMVLAEFPTTIEAAQRSHELGLKVMMGAPNVVRGGSHSGNIAAHELATLGVLDALSSDYFPSSLLDAVFKLASDERNALDLASATRLATANPAAALNLTDRGTIKEGLRADVMLVGRKANQAVIEQVWRQGNRVF
ncbi:MULTISPECIES: alpha-D-ribose 1-methylphosphonate 5-triphosphate diphosphatase [unclassified Photobacterium]|uniref:alpha-D-ribose 1-methylphosphonate 5-triphosphate diphosphatase n=1 Tax=unclassified Photobacterium TaxID=2628852 RepID=UPI000D164569|nr:MULTISPECIES: alpha-D-ribose 1-methylphosphonate 5-triphosphate diphosphatase [unclassified Photobacterium]PSV42042.1 phosphonate metabolism protein PhnM [Photobacterium sp. GB-36]PSV50348.1 phosphonate metabolism protein PhnM [Photobacterium sp. GB-1]